MNNPRAVFENPKKYLAFITIDQDDKIEDQFFDRKEVTDRGNTNIRNVQKTISAFTNSNKEGGLLIMGVSGNGTIKGIKKFGEKTINSFTNISAILRNHNAEVKQFNCVNENGENDRIMLIYAGYIEKAICHTLDNDEKAWIRSGPQCTIVNKQMWKNLERQKGIKNFETSICCEYSYEDLDKEIFENFSGISNASEDEIIKRLYNKGAIKKKDENYYFTNVGFLFFAKNPQRILNFAHIRLSKFDVNSSDSEQKGLPIFEKKFDGPIAKQILKFRAYVEESGFFKNYKYRRLGGGFIEEPEFPLNAIDEAIVNAVAHRNYGISLHIECIKYLDALYIENPGILSQRDKTVPDKFLLNDTVLVSTPINSLLVDWLKEMKDSKGSSFVQKWGEGTNTIRKAMAELNLPSPEYKTSIKSTSLTLENNYIEREAKINQLNSRTTEILTEYLNFFEIEIFNRKARNEKIDLEDFAVENKIILNSITNKLSSIGWYIDKSRFGIVKAHRKNSLIKTGVKNIDSKLKIFPAFNFQVRKYHNKLYLVLEYSLEVKSIQRLSVLDIEAEKLIGRRTNFTNGMEWLIGKIIDIVNQTVVVQEHNSEEKHRVDKDDVILFLSREEKQNSLGQDRNTLEKFTKKHSLLTSKNSARERSATVLTEIKRLETEIFPLSINKFFLSLIPSPQSISFTNDFELDILPEPKVEFGYQEKNSNIREGITTHGAFQPQSKTLKVVPICQRNFDDKMRALIRRLQIGKYKYKGFEKTFKSRLQYDSIYSVNSAENVLSECERLLAQYPEWIGNSENDRIFLVQIPDDSVSRNNPKSPYFLVKKYLFENGIPCQMVSNQTLNNPDWKDLNLALNISAKCGITPWVLPNKIPDADFFIGFSYTQERQFKKGGKRLIGYANVIDEYGNWKFFSGSNSYFNYENKKDYFVQLTKEIFNKLDTNLSNTAIVHFHYSSKFSTEDRLAILEEAKKIRPDGKYVFTSINNSHLLRLYDNKPETDGSLARGSFVKLSDNQLLISTTGFNSFGKVMGTPRPLEATVWQYGKGSDNEPIDLRATAVQLLNLTKLNWASSSSISSEPITTKYASDIAYLTMAFLEIDNRFKLHRALENTPWFI